MTKYEAFQNDEVKRDWLLTNMSLVLEVIDACKERLEGSRVNEGVVNPNIGNACYQQIMGAKSIKDDVPGLTKPPGNPKEVQPRRQYTEADLPELKKRAEEERLKAREARKNQGGK